MNKIFFTFLYISISLFAHVDQEVLYEFEKRCMVCHDTYSKNNIAPPIVAINKIYSKYTNNDLMLSKNMIKSFLVNPTKQKALMKPAISLYNLMPKQSLTTKQIDDFAEVILEINYEIPDWFDDHFNSHKLNLEHQ